MECSWMRTREESLQRSEERDPSFEQIRHRLVEEDLVSE